MTHLPAIHSTIDQSQVQADLDRLTALPLSQHDTLPSQIEIEASVARLCAPAKPVWVMARVAALLTPYYDKETPQAVREIEAEDWLASLSEYPQWAIERACRWWKSDGNAKRSRRPVEGDIAERCRAEMRGVKAVPDLIARKRAGKFHEPEPERRPVSAERAAEIMAAAGYTPKRMDAAE